MARRQSLMRIIFGNRSVVEIMVLLFTFMVVLVVSFSTIAVIVAELIDSSTDTSVIVDSLTSIVTGLIAALLGLLAGQAAASSELGKRPDGTLDDVPLPGEEP